MSKELDVSHINQTEKRSEIRQVYILSHNNREKIERTKKDLASTIQVLRSQRKELTSAAKYSPNKEKRVEYEKTLKAVRVSLMNAKKALKDLNELDTVQDTVQTELND